ncbi:flavin reductase [Xylophilus sp.]|uniref:flavin reductase n=1 Tax=Xylophilus sp. TaxID=2653893 RepID=UPI0013BC94CA|nr:flavin reductase [Xylophilus sp.]KAF1041516.1 MAG: FMN reductase (NADH) RutF [Xylophilus sp.]
MNAIQATVIQDNTASDEALKLGFRNAMSRLGAAVNIVTTDGPGGRTGFAATAVCSISDTPPSLLVCINRNSSAYKPVLANRVLCVNVTADAHQPVCQLFASKTPAAERFALGAWMELETGSLVLEDALEAFDCRVSAVHSSGSHDLLICDVLAMKPRTEGRGLVYFDRAYRVV